MSLTNGKIFFLGVDGGGTKTIARLENLNTGQQWQVKGGPASLTNDFNLALKTCESLIQTLCIQACCDHTDIICVFGLAGAGHKNKAAEFKRSILVNNDDVDVYTDAKTSLYGANEGKPIAVVSLGTGSVGAVLAQDGDEIQIGGWGFNVGDEGSGAKMGVLIIRAVLSEIENVGNVKSLLAKVIVKKLGDDLEGVLAWSASATPSDFASLAPLVFEYHQVCSVAKDILMTHVGHVESLINKTSANKGMVKNTSENAQLPVVLLGGLSEPTLPFLSPTIKARLVATKGNALDGACLLAKKLAQYRITRCLTNGN